MTTLRAIFGTLSTIIQPKRTEYFWFCIARCRQADGADNPCLAPRKGRRGSLQPLTTFRRHSGHHHVLTFAIRLQQGCAFSLFAFYTLFILELFC
jgi:hypothetical protein